MLWASPGRLPAPCGKGGHRTTASDRRSHRPWTCSTTSTESIDERHLLKHPFYTKWVAGTLPREAMQEYARQYFAFESSFPRFLSAMHTREERPEVRQGLLDNLWDEEHGEANHAELWLRFAEGIGVDRDDVRSAPRNEATQKLVDLYAEITSDRARRGRHRGDVRLRAPGPRGRPVQDRPGSRSTTVSTRVRPPSSSSSMASSTSSTPGPNGSCWAASPTATTRPSRTPPTASSTPGTTS